MPVTPTPTPTGTCFSAWDVGGCGCAAPGPTKICVTQCSSNSPLVGATVTVSGVGGCVTDATGCCSLSGITTGTYTVTITNAGGDPVMNGAVTLNGGATNTFHFNGGTSGVCCGTTYVPNTLTATDAQGSFTMGFFGHDGSGNLLWGGGHAVTLTSVPVDTTGGLCNVQPPSSGPVRVCYLLTCYLSATPKFNLLRTWSNGLTYAGTNYYYQDPSGFPTAGRCSAGLPGPCGGSVATASGSANATTTAPFAISFSLSDDPGFVMPDPVGSGSVTISQ